MDNFKNINPSYVNAKVMELAAIWVAKPVYVSRNGELDKTSRITKGDHVRIEDNRLMNYGVPNFKITSCLGNIYNSFLMIEVESLVNTEFKQTISLL